MTEEDRYVGKLKGKCIVAIQRYSDYTTAESSDGTTYIYGSSSTGKEFPINKLTKKEPADKLLRADEPPLTEVDSNSRVLLRKFFDAWDVAETLGISPTGADVFARKLIELVASSDEELDQIAPPFHIGRKGNRYIREVEATLASWSWTDLAAVNFYDGYLTADQQLALPQDVPTDEEKYTAAEKLLYHYARSRTVENKNPYITLTSREIIKRLNPGIHQLIDELDAQYNNR